MPRLLTARARAAQHAYLRRYNAPKRRYIVAAKKRPCLDCGKRFPTCCMDFDHRDPKEKCFSIGVGYRSVSLDALIAEIAKCDLVCANCHRIRTHKPWLYRLRQKRRCDGQSRPFSVGCGVMG